MAASGPQMPNTLTPAWREWVLENLQRNCTPDSLVDAMVERQFDRAFAQAVVALIASETAPPSARAAPPSSDGDDHPYDYERSRIAVRNVISAGDRDVRVLMRLAHPDLVLFGDVLSSEECELLIRMSSEKLARSTIVDPTTGAELVIPDRTSSGTFFNLSENPFIETIDRRLGALLAWPHDRAEGLQILHYRIGGEYKPHYDYFPPNDPGSAVHTSQGGQRVASLVMYLNDVPQGGETIFPEIGVVVPPRRGSAVYFSYFNSQGEIDPMTLHGGAPVLDGEKWIATKWLRQYQRA